jgi:hypothetical protein
VRGCGNTWAFLFFQLLRRISLLFADSCRFLFCVPIYYWGIALLMGKEQRMEKYAENKSWD